MSKLPTGKSGTQQAKNYPTLTNYLKTNAQSDIMGSSNIMAGFYKHSGGNLDNSAVKQATTWGEGPTVQIMDNPGSDGDAWFLSDGSNGYYNAETNTIQISTKLSEQLENASGDDKQTALFSAFVTLTHETVHYGDYLDGERQSGGEPGFAFEVDVFNSREVDTGENIITDPLGMDPSNMNDAKQLIQIMKDSGKEDVIPTVPNYK